jgi:hypothetical protein
MSKVVMIRLTNKREKNNKSNTINSNQTKITNFVMLSRNCSARALCVVLVYLIVVFISATAALIYFCLC